MEIYNNDCLERLPLLPDKSIDMFILDLPYQQTHLNWDIKIDINLLWFQLKRLAKSSKTPFFFFCTMKFGIEIINANPTWFKYDIIWIKPRLCNPLNAIKRFASAHETILVFYDKTPIYNALQFHTKIIQNGIAGKNPSMGYNTNTIQRGTYEPKLPLDWIECSNKAGTNTKHSTQKPIEILEKLIKYYSQEGDTILDPTMGCGSTGIACRNLNRHFIGIEKDINIFKIASDALIII